LLGFPAHSGSMQQCRPDSVLSVGGLGPVRLGMTQSQAQHQARVPLDFRQSDVLAGSPCESLSARDASGLGDFHFLLADDRGIYYVVVTAASQRRAVGIHTPRGIHIGSTRAEVLRTYGRQLEAHRQQDQELLVLPGPGGRALGFVIDSASGQVAMMSAGA